MRGLSDTMHPLCSKNENTLNREWSRGCGEVGGKYKVGEGHSAVVGL